MSRTELTKRRRAAVEKKRQEAAAAWAKQQEADARVREVERQSACIKIQAIQRGRRAREMYRKRLMDQKKHKVEACISPPEQPSESPGNDESHLNPSNGDRLMEQHADLSPFLPLLPPPEDSNEHSVVVKFRQA